MASAKWRRKVKTVMSHYLDDPELTAETIVDGWLLTGDLGRFDSTGQLQLFGRKKNMIVTEGGKNIYPEDIETAFDGIPVKEYCVFAANYIWPAKQLGKEMLFLVLRLEPNQEFNDTLREQIAAANRRLPDFKRVGGYLIWDKDFPRTASMKIKRPALAEEIGKTKPRGCRRTVTGKFLAIVNPAAGGGRCRKLVGPALERLRAGGLTLDVVETQRPVKPPNCARRLRAWLSQVHRRGR